MDCSNYRTMISRELDGEIEREEREALDRHVETCPDCREFRAALIETFTIHRQLGEVEPPATILPAVLAEVERPERVGWFRGWLRVAVPAAAALVMLLGFQIGDLLTETLASGDMNEQAEVLELDYLDEYPPGSLGDALALAVEGGEDDER